MTTTVLAAVSLLFAAVAALAALSTVWMAIAFRREEFRRDFTTALITFISGYEADDASQCESGLYQFRRMAALYDVGIRQGGIRLAFYEMANPNTPRERVYELATLVLDDWTTEANPWVLSTLGRVLTSRSPSS